MANQNIQDWDEPLPSCDDDDDTDDGLTYSEKRQKDNIKKLTEYVENMSFIPATPPTASAYTEMLAKPHKRKLVDNAKFFSNLMEPSERGQRMRCLAGPYNTLTTEELEKDIREKKAQEYRRENALKRKQRIYYEMLNKLERQCRVQYLNVLINKFGNFIGKLATTMRIPPNLVEPYARMQRGIFCNILLAIGVQPSTQAAIYYNTKEGSEYEVCHKLSHALLSLIIKALDSAATRNSADMEPIEADFEMDNYIKDRLMCAAEKKVQNMAKSKAEEPVVPNFEALFEKCDSMRYRPCK